MWITYGFRISYNVPEMKQNMLTFPENLHILPEFVLSPSGEPANSFRVCIIPFRRTCTFFRSLYYPLPENLHILPEFALNPSGEPANSFRVYINPFRRTCTFFQSLHYPRMRQNRITRPKNLVILEKFALSMNETDELFRRA